MIVEEEIQFDFSKIDGENSRANAIMQWLVNRAFVFDKQRYTNICLNIEDTAEGCVANEIAFAINAFSGVKFYALRKELKKCRFYSKGSVIVPVSKRKYEKISNQPETLRWNVRHTVDIPYAMTPFYAEVFYGVGHKTIKFIAETLYAWDDNRKAYIKAKKEAIKAAFKEAKKAIKEAKQNA